MATRLRDLAQLVDGTLVGDGDLLVTGAATYAEATPGHITFIDDNQTAHRLAGCQASAAIVLERGTFRDRPVIQVANVHVAFATIVAHFHPPKQRQRHGIDPRAIVSPTAKLGRDVEIGPLAVIGDDVQIGDGCTIHSAVQIMEGCRLAEGVTIFPNAVLYENTVVGPRAIIHAGAVLGGYGFGYKTVDGVHQLSPQLGHVVLEADVDVGACSTIDRGTYGPTTIGAGSKIDNQVMIAHNCRIGRHNLICSQVGIAGSTTTGDHVILAGQVGIRDHVKIGDRAILGAKAGIHNDIPAGEFWFGCPATHHRDQRLIQAVTAKLPEFRRQLKTLKHQVEQLLPPEQEPHSQDQEHRDAA
jgi:UDP-3-O-[3-hydroxymyristoyl] glucosamine N-acyltransferase